MDRPVRFRMGLTQKLHYFLWYDRAEMVESGTTEVELFGAGQAHPWYENPWPSVAGRLDRRPERGIARIE